jgi:predicted permease
MAEFVTILYRVIMPVFIIIGAGYFIQAVLKFDLTGFTKIIFYILIPCLIFSRLYKTELPMRSLGLALLFAAAVIVVSGFCTLPVSLARRYRAPMRAAFALSVMFCNSGNYGLPVIELVFGQNPVATSLQVLVLTAQNILTFTLGVFMVAKGSSSFRASLGRMLRFPSVYAILLAISCRMLQLRLWEPLWIPIDAMASTLVPVALLTLGMQLARIRLTRGIGDVLLSALCRLLIGPAIALGLIFIFRYQGIMAHALLISASMPSAVNTALLAIEMENEPQFASQAVLYSTLLSICTVTLTIYLGGLMFR